MGSSCGSDFMSCGVGAGWISGTSGPSQQLCGGWLAALAELCCRLAGLPTGLSRPLGLIAALMDPIACGGKGAGFSGAPRWVLFT
mmetsp:Transcript_16549/g.38824  ORF Transcript_16549/g.38824 Transcript_16549/m.38824 type:complete len:85 (-) Transcript_16549:115-369(-)